MIRKWLEHPLTRGRDLDDPGTTTLRRQIIQDKPFLRLIYREWYQAIVASLPVMEGAVLELGSGAGFLSELIPGLISSEVFFSPGVRIILNGEHIPFADDSLRAIVMVNVLHHIPQARLFFEEARRCVCPGGVVVMIEPWVTPWSRWVYRYHHHEPFDPEAASWDFPSSGPLSGANSALPWIVFERDREIFHREFPEWEILSIKRMMPFRYLVSGGISTRNLMPAWSFPVWQHLEERLDHLAMFAQITLRVR